MINRINVNEKFYFCPQLSGEVNDDNFVNIGKSKIGKILISDSFGPCQAVVVKLNDGQYALYHAFTCWDDDMDCQEFISAIKNKAEYVLIFQKSLPFNNLKKAPILATNLEKHLKCDIYRIHVEGYRGVYVNADSNELILFREGAYTKNGNETNILCESPKSIEVELISMEQTKFDMENPELNRNKFFNQLNHKSPSNDAEFVEAHHNIKKHKNKKCTIL